MHGFFEQKGTKRTKEEIFFVAFVCFCGNCFPTAAQMKIFEQEGAEETEEAEEKTLCSLCAPVQTSSLYLRESA